MRTLLRVSYILLLIGAIGTGCSSNGSTKTSVSAPDGDVLITLWALNDGWDWMGTAISQFMKENPHIEVELTQYETDPIKETLKIAASTRTLPDMWFTWGGTLGSFYTENSMTMDLTRVASDHQWSSIYNKAALDMVTYDGKVSGVPLHLNVLGMWYSKNIFDKAGLEVPSTFAEFESALRRLKDSGITPLAFGSKGGWHTMRLTEQLLEHFAGPELHDRLNSLEASWNNPAVISTFAKLKEYTDKGYFPKDYSMLDPLEAEAQFYQGQAGFINEGSWFDGNLTKIGLDNTKFGIFTFPTGQMVRRASVFVEMFQINSESEPAEQEAAVKLGEFISNYITEIDHGSPATVKVSNSGIAPHMQPLLDTAGAGSFLITDQALPQEIVQKLFEAQDKIALNEWTPAQAAREIEEAVQIYKRRQK